ncbi:hypothetical protein M5689_007670 [Euphorbia peplus]|nr:hypothetical protein M5689_007670 [Euphorbia peplus]
MENISDPKIPNSYFLPSEPPDIRNWFPSYKYESFVLDTYDPLGGSMFKESYLEGDSLAVIRDVNGEKEENLGRIDDDNHEEQPFIRMPDPTCSSLPVLSEPPHIKNWYSSYVYESSVLNTGEDLEGSLSKNESECEKVLAFEESRRKSEGSFGDFHKNNVDGDLWPNKLVKCTSSYANKPSSENPDSSQTPSTLSEPPEIANWFSSYVYKSPESCGFADEETEGEEDCILNQHEGEKELNSSEFGQTSITNEAFIDEKVNSNGVLRFKSSRDDEEQEHPSLNRQKQNSLLKDDVVSCKSKDRPPKRKLILKKDLSENSETKAQAEVNLAPLNSGVLKEKICTISGKENKENEVPKNGFITPKNQARLNNENSLYKPNFGLQKCSQKDGRSSSNSGNEALKRRVLSERTNMEQAAEAIGVTGKWQCPQNRKPKLGPPLKQLRLERWITKL